MCVHVVTESGHTSDNERGEIQLQMSCSSTGCPVLSRDRWDSARGNFQQWPGSQEVVISPVGGGVCVSKSKAFHREALLMADPQPCTGTSAEPLPLCSLLGSSLRHCGLQKLELSWVVASTSAHSRLQAPFTTSHLMSASRSLNRGVLLRSSSTAMSLRGTVEETSIRVEGGHVWGQKQLLLKHCGLSGSCSSCRGGETTQER